MRATQILMHEHELIRQALGVLDTLAGRVAANEVPPAADLAGLVAFLVDFADGCHHVKEETLLFPALASAGLPHGQGPLAAMLDQHEQGRRLVGVMRRELPALEGDPGARERFATAAREYVALLEQHIRIENEVLFPGADGMLSEAGDAAIAAAMDRHEEREMGAEVHRRFHRLLDDLVRRYR
jgi:hemerythrin-like domain-containing protein